jgi:glyoxylase-like metal-dependent hydrolase (beta-lactamase superfamily II)
MTRDHLELGTIQVHGLRDGFFWLDGGSMFGVVPKVLWRNIYSADQDNRIRLGLNSILIDTGRHRLLVDTGIGPDIDKRLQEFYSVEREPGLIGELLTLGFGREDIDYVINTHLHFDHCGGNTYRSAEGRFVPSFPDAAYIIQKCEWEAGLNPSGRDKPSYYDEYFAPLEEFGQVELVDGDREIVPGVEVVLAAGHTACHQCVKVVSEDKTLFFLGDMVPTSGHVGLPYIMSYDLFPQTTMEAKERFFRQAIEEDWIVAFNHDPDIFFGRISVKKGKFTCQPL